MRVYTKALERASGNLNREFHAEAVQIIGNKMIRVVLEATGIDETAQDENILLALVSQKNELGADVTAFTYDDATQLLTPTATIPNILEFEFDHTITYLGSSQSGNNNDANDVVEVVQRVVNNNTAPATERQIEVDRLSSALNLPDGETIEVPKETEPEKPANPTELLSIDSNISVGWALKSYNNPVVTCSAIRIVLDIVYYDKTAIGGN